MASDMTTAEVAIIVLCGFIGAMCSGCSVVPEPTDADLLEMASTTESYSLGNLPGAGDLSGLPIGDCSDDPPKPGHSYVGCIYRHGTNINGLGVNGESPGVLASAVRPGHTKRAQSAAPHHIRFSGCTWDVSSGIPIYLAPGAHHIEVSDSCITGSGDSVAIYLDAESANNTLARLTITHTGTRREAIAVDGSAHNLIADNHINGHPGAVYIYRNCGEGGAPRHQRPTHNVLMGNVTDAPIIIGSRQGGRRYCGADASFGLDLPDTSAASDLDWAQYNILDSNVTTDGSPAHITITQQPNLTIGGP